MFRWTLTIAALSLFTGTALAQWYDNTVDIAGASGAYAESAAKSRFAQKQTNRAVDEMVNKRKQLIEEVQASEGYRGAKASVKDSYTAWKQKESSIVRDLEKNDPNYQAAMKGRDGVQKSIDDLRKMGGTIGGFNDLYNHKAIYTEQMRKIQEEAFEKEGGLAIKKQWEDATAALEALDQDIKIKVERHPEMVAAKDKAKDARIEYEKSFIDLSRDAARLKGTEAQAVYDNRARDQAYNAFSRYPVTGWGGWYRW